MTSAGVSTKLVDACEEGRTRLGAVPVLDAMEPSCEAPDVRLSIALLVPLSTWTAIVLPFSVLPDASGAETPPRLSRDYHITPVPFSRVRVDDGFWTSIATPASPGTPSRTRSG